MTPYLRVRAFKDLVEKDRKCKPIDSMCLRPRNKALTAIVADYKAQFRLQKDKRYKLLHSRSTIQFTTTKPVDGYIFKCIYVCLRSLKQGFLEGCRKVLFVGARL